MNKSSWCSEAAVKDESDVKIKIGRRGWMEGGGGIKTRSKLVLLYASIGMVSKHDRTDKISLLDNINYYVTYLLVTLKINFSFCLSAPHSA